MAVACDDLLLIFLVLVLLGTLILLTRGSTVVPSIDTLF